MSDAVQGQNENSPDSVFSNFSIKERVEALKSLALVLLREVESLQAFAKLDEGKKSIDQINLTDEVQRYEADLIRLALIQAKGRQRSAAKILGTKTTTLNTKIKRYGIELLKGDQAKKTSP